MNNIDISKYNNLELALMGCLGYLGNGMERYNLLKDRYNDVQKLINEIMNDQIPEPTHDDINIQAIREGLLSLEPNHDDYKQYIQDVINSILKVKKEDGEK